MGQWFEKNKWVFLILIGIGVVAAGGLFASRWQPAPAIIIEPPLPTATPGPIQVYVSGAVVNADVYTLPPGAIARDAVEAAGGITDDAMLDQINLARKLKDGDQVYIPAEGEAIVVEGEGEGEVVVTGPVNINIATQEQLETLPGIGPAIALRIIEYREENGLFETIEDIQNVPGIGPATFENIRDLITVG